MLVRSLTLYTANSAHQVGVDNSGYGIFAFQRALRLAKEGDTMFLLTVADPKSKAANIAAENKKTFRKICLERKVIEYKASLPMTLFFYFVALTGANLLPLLSLRIESIYLSITLQKK